MGSNICMMRIVNVVLILSIQLNLGEAARSHVARWRYKRDDNDKYNGSSGRMSCPPGMGSGGAFNNDTAVILLVDVTKAYENVWKSQINLLMEVVSFLQGAKIGVVTISCPSEMLFSLGHYTGNEIRSKILELHPKSTTNKGTALAFNIAAQHLIYANASNRRVIILSGGESPDCVKEMSGPSEFDIADMWRREGIKALVLYVATNQSSLAYMKKLASDADAVIVVDNIDSVDKSVYHKIAKWLCTSVDTPLGPILAAHAKVAVNKITANVTTVPKAAPSTSTEATATKASPTEATEAPSTKAPASETPSSKARARKAFTSKASATKAATTEASASGAPSSGALATKAPTIEASAFKAPTTEAPAIGTFATGASIENSTTEASATEASTKIHTTEAPASGAPSSGALATKAPTIEASAFKAPTTEAPTIGTFATGASTKIHTTEAPASGAPSSGALATKAPTVEASAFKAPTTEAPTIGTFATGAFIANSTTEASATEASSSEIPVIKGSVTKALITEAPATKAQRTEAAAVNKVTSGVTLVTSVTTPPVCVDCNSNTETKSILFIMDESGTIAQKGVKQGKEFVLKVLGKIRNAKAGAVVISCPSMKSLDLKLHTAVEIRRWVKALKSSSSSSLTATYDAYKIADDMLNADDSNRKVVVVVSDGESSNCANGEATGTIYRDPDPWEFSIAEKWRKNGVHIIYIEVASVRVYTSNIKEIVGQKEDQIIKIKDLNGLTEEVVQNVIQKICCDFKL